MEDPPRAGGREGWCQTGTAARGLLTVLSTRQSLCFILL